MHGHTFGVLEILWNRVEKIFTENVKEIKAIYRKCKIQQSLFFTYFQKNWQILVKFVIFNKFCKNGTFFAL